MSMQSDDWRSRLESLRGALPADGDTDTAQEPAQEAAPAQGRLDIVFEKKGRAGKTATIICGFTIGDDEVERVASRLKRSLARGGEILIQGDRRSDVLRELARMGFKARVV